MLKQCLPLFPVLALLLPGCQSQKSTPVSAPPHFTVFDLGTLGGEFGCGVSINNRGQVVGRLGKNTSDAQSFVWERGKITKIGPHGGGMTIASQINDSGQIAGAIDPRHDTSIDSRGEYAFIWQQGRLIRLDTPTVKTSYAEGINSKGDIVGEADFGMKRYGGFLWQHDKMVELVPPSGNGSNPRAVNNTDQVAGLCGNDAVVWMHGPSSPQKIGQGDARAINNKGQVVGACEGHAFLWQEGIMTDLGVLGNGGDSTAFNINDHGQIVGNSSPAVKSATEKYTHAFLWQNGTMFDLNNLLAGGSKFEIAVGNAINNRGQILCSAILNGKSHTVILTPTK